MGISLRLMSVLLLVLAGCGGSLQKEPETPAQVWPPAPDPARIAFVRAFSKPADLGIRRGLLERLEDVLLGEQDSRLVRPMAVAASGEVIYVADPGAGGVHRFDPANGRYALIRGPNGAPLPSPVGLAAGAAGAVYVTDSKLAQVFVIAPEASSAAPVRLAAGLRQPTGIAFDPARRRLFVSDTAAHHVLVFGDDHRLLATIGRRGEGAGEFNFPTLLWQAGDGRLHVTDSLNFRIQTFDADGRFAGMIGSPGDRAGAMARPKGVAADRDGHLYVADALQNGVQIFDAAGRFLLAFGEQGQGRGEFWLPAGIFIGDDRIYVADTHNRRVQVLRYLGAPS